MIRSWIFGVLFILVPGENVWGKDTLFHAVRHFTNADGLPQNSVKAIARDEAGFVWISTESGLTRFDGARFQNFTARQYALRSNRFTQIVSWPGDTRFYAFNDYRQALLLQQGRASIDQSYFSHQNSFFKTLRNKNDKLLTYSDLHVGERGIWQTGDTLLLPVSAQRVYLSGPVVYSLYEDGQQKFTTAFNRSKHDLIFLLGDQLFVFNERNGKFTQLAPEGPRRLLMKDVAAKDKAKPMRLLVNPLQPDYAILCCGRTLYRIRFNQGQLEVGKITESFDAIKEDVVSVWWDQAAQKLLLGSNTNGLFILSRSLFQWASSGSTIANQVYYAQVALLPNRIFTGQGHIFQAPLNYPVISLPDWQKMTDKYNLAIDESNYLWTKRDCTVFRILPAIPRRVQQWSFPASVTHLSRGMDGVTWIGLKDGALMKIGEGKNVPQHLFRLPAEITCIVQQDKDRIWLGTTDGLYSYHIGQNKYSMFPESKGKHIRSIYIDVSGTAWISSYGEGFFGVTGNKWINFPLDIRKYLLNAHCILEDSQGFLWITTNNGLFQAAKADLLAYADRPVFQPYYHYYNQDDGLPTNEFNGGCSPCGIKLPDGMFSLPTMKGLVWFYPDATKLMISHFPIHVDRILLDNQEVPVTKELVLSRNMQQLKVEINTPFWDNRENLHLSYALTGAKEEPVWVPLENESISFPTLPPGNYMLEIRKLEGFGVNNYTAFRIKLVVPHHWLLDPFVIILLAVLLLTGGIVLYWFRTRYIRGRNTLLEKKVAAQTNHLQQALEHLTQSQQELVQQSEWQQKMLAVLSHDIKAPLKYLMLATGRIREGMIRDKLLAYQEPSNTIYEYSSRLYYTMDNLLQYIKTQSAGGIIEKSMVDLHLLLDEKQLIFQHIATGSLTTIENRVAPGTEVYTNQTLLAIVLHNLIDNSVKVTEKGLVSLDAIAGRDGTSIIVADTGIGMSPQLVRWFNQQSSENNSLTGANASGSGIGLYIVKGIAALLAIDVSVSSTEAGTEFRLFIPAYS